MNIDDLVKQALAEKASIAPVPDVKTAPLDEADCVNFDCNVCSYRTTRPDGVYDCKPPWW